MSSPDPPGRGAQAKSDKHTWASHLSSLEQGGGHACPFRPAEGDRAPARGLHSRTSPTDLLETTPNRCSIARLPGSLFAFGLQWGLSRPDSRTSASSMRPGGLGSDTCAAPHAQRAKQPMPIALPAVPAGAPFWVACRPGQPEDSRDAAPDICRSLLLARGPPRALEGSRPQWGRSHALASPPDPPSSIPSGGKAVLAALVGDAVACAIAVVAIVGPCRGRGCLRRKRCHCLESAPGERGQNRNTRFRHWLWHASISDRLLPPWSARVGLPMSGQRSSGSCRVGRIH